ncbi:MAG TPA: hypothetical protein VMN38_05465 [Sphingomicrobium sp.]|nr:hypothetical protein [Sphingomicrobium sp.]
MPSAITALKGRIRLPEAVPPFGTRSYRLFSLLWAAAFLLALIGPGMGLYYRYSSPENNSQLMLGSRAGFAVSQQDATRIRFPVGPYSKALGIVPSDDIVAVFGLPMPEVMPMTSQALARHGEDPSYIAMANLLFGTDQAEVPLTLRSPDGRVREVTVTTGEQHIKSGARSAGISPKLLSLVDLLHVVSYPFLLWAAWILHRRNARDAVSSILSLAILLTIGAEQPSSTYLASAGVPRWINVAVYDLGNIFLLCGILLFPHGKLSWRLVLLLACLPLLLFLEGPGYQAMFIGFMIVAVLMLLQCLRQAPLSDLRQQIRWALLGFTGYALFRSISIAGDLLKTSTGSFAMQLQVEMLAGLSLGLAILLLQLGLLVALLRYRLYDAESIISRTASIAIVTLILGAAFAGLMEGIITQMQDIYPDSQTPAAMIGAVMATMMIHPLHGRVQAWAERRFHKNLLELREGLPEAMRDIRDVASPESFIKEVLSRVNQGVHSTRSAFVVDREVKQAIGISNAEVQRWLLTFQPADIEVRLQCDPDDRLFPLRLRVEDGSGTALGWVLIGPRPDGSIAGKDEREALAEIAVPLARSLRIVLNRESEKRELLQLLESHRLRIERMERGLQG